MIKIVLEKDTVLIEKIIRMIEEKIEWMRSHNRNQWQNISYTERYNASYLKKCINSGDVLLVDIAGSSICGCLLLKHHGHYESLYENSNKALYVLHFVSLSLTSGTKLLSFAKEYAKEYGYNCLRGDVNNKVKGLIGYYQKLGAKTVYQGEDFMGEYQYSLLQYDL